MTLLESYSENENPIYIVQSELALPRLSADLEGEKLDPQLETDTGVLAFPNDQVVYYEDGRVERHMNDYGNETTIDPDSAAEMQGLPGRDDDEDDDEDGDANKDEDDEHGNDEGRKEREAERAIT